MELIQSIARSFDAVELRRRLRELSQHQDERVREAAACWMAALGALTKLLAEPGAETDVLTYQAAALLVQGARSWYRVIGDEARSAAKHKKALYATPKGLEVLHRLARLSIDFEAALEGDDDAAQRIVGGGEREVQGAR
jgi:hypothetical protein